MQVSGYDNPITALVEFEPNFYDLLLIDAIDGWFSTSPEFSTEGPQCRPVQWIHEPKCYWFNIISIR